MRNNIRQKSILIIVPLFVMLSFVNMVAAGDVTMPDKDSVITSIVVDKIENDSQLMGSSIDVETMDGEVTLKGTVRSNADINRAAELARSIDGVKMVDNRLKREQGYSSSSSTFGGSSRAADCPVGANWAC